MHVQRHMIDWLHSMVPCMRTFIQTHVASPFNCSIRPSDQASTCIQDASDTACVVGQVMEELMSIADGQVVLERAADATVGVDARLSISRIGSRAYPPALANLAPSIRLQLAQVWHRLMHAHVHSLCATCATSAGQCRAIGCVCAHLTAACLEQAVDAARFGPEGQVLREQQGFVNRFRAALTQLAGHPVPLEELVSHCFHSNISIILGCQLPRRNGQRQVASSPAGMHQHCNDTPLPLRRCIFGCELQLESEPAHSLYVQVALLVALQHGAFRGVATEVLQMRLRIYVQYLRRTRPQELRTIAATQAVSDSGIAALSEAYHALCHQFEWG